MRIVCLSDTHTRHRKIEVPDGDLLIHAGDACGRGTLEEFVAFANWWGELPHKEKVFVPGNHDWICQREPEICRALLDGELLIDREAIINGLHVYGSPWQPEFYNWAFNLPRGHALRDKWALIPDRTDILVTHGPPDGILDMIPDGQHVGCTDLLRRVWEVRPKVHVFGHIHLSHGLRREYQIDFVNAAICTEEYRPNNQPIVVDI